MNLNFRVDNLLKLKQSSRNSLAKLLGVPQTTFNRYFREDTQSALAQYLWNIMTIFPDVRRDWLFFGEGEPFSDRQSPVPPQPAKTEPPMQPVAMTQAVPMVGFASCGIMGWSGVMTFPVAATAPHMRPGMIAVMATGESMIPAGIGHGHICFCDPHAEPMPGECVYVERHDNLRTLKTFLGRGEAAGYGIRPGEIGLQGWLDKNAEGHQKELFLGVDERLVKTIAPVIYVQRRM